jgi:flagellin-like hook-associated protein FlgL
MFVRNNLSTQTLFSEPQGYIDNPSALFRRPTETYEEEYLTPVSTDTPISVEINTQTQELSSRTSSANSNISNALSRNSTMQSYMQEAISIIEELEELAESAEESTTIDEARSELNQEAEDLLQKFDDLYLNAQYGNEYIMRGGSGTVAAGTDAQEIVFHYGNLSRSDLSISDIDLSTQSSAEDAAANLETALNNLETQYNIIVEDGENLSAYSSVNSESLDSTKLAANYELQGEYAQTALQNSQAAIKARMVFAVNIQGEELRVNSINSFSNQVEKMAKTIREINEKTMEEKAEGAAKAEDEYKISLEKEEDISQETKNLDKALTQAVSAVMPNDEPVDNAIELPANVNAQVVSTPDE